MEENIGRERVRGMRGGVAGGAGEGIGGGVREVVGVVFGKERLGGGMGRVCRIACWGDAGEDAGE